MGCVTSTYDVKQSDAIYNEKPANIAQCESDVGLLAVSNLTNVKPLGKGKYGFVFLVKSRTDKYLAVKYISKDRIFEAKHIRQAKQEFDILSKVHHAFIMQFFGAFDTPSCIGFALEYMMGGELYSLMNSRKSKLTINQAKFYFCEIALALSYLHDEAKIVHRDLKPENLLVDVSGHIKLADFGFAVEIDSKDGTDNLRDGCGTVMYLAPEIAAGFHKHMHGYPVDWWSLGCVLAEMVTGVAPFGDTLSMTKYEVFNNITHGNPKLPLLMDASLSKLLNGLLHKDSAKRFNWATVKEAAWVQQVPWSAFLDKKVMPPWQPYNQATLPESAINFPEWDRSQFVDPSVPCESDQADAYCAILGLRKTAKLGRVMSTNNFQTPSRTASGLSVLTREKSSTGSSSTSASLQIRNISMRQMATESISSVATSSLRSVMKSPSVSPSPSPTKENSKKNIFSSVDQVQVLPSPNKRGLSMTKQLASSDSVPDSMVATIKRQQSMQKLSKGPAAVSRQTSQPLIGTGRNAVSGGGGGGGRQSSLHTLNLDSSPDMFVKFKPKNESTHL